MVNFTVKIIIVSNRDNNIDFLLLSYFYFYVCNSATVIKHKNTKNKQLSAIVFIY